MKTFTILLILLITVTVAIAQTGPGAPPPVAEPPGIPIDGGITAFLAAAGLAGVWIISKLKKEKN